MGLWARVDYREDTKESSDGSAIDRGIGWLMLGTEYGSLEHQEWCSIDRQSRKSKSRICD